LLAVYRFRQQQGNDSYSTRLLTHFLLHCHTGLRVAALARLLGVSRPTASRQQGISSKQAVQQAHHRMDGRPYGKLLPRYAGAILEFRLSHPDASRANLIDFVDATFGVRVSRIALYHFLKKFGLDRIPATPVPTALPPPDPTASPQPRAVMPVPAPPPPFSSAARCTRAPS
jgi:transposase